MIKSINARITISFFIVYIPRTTATTALINKIVENILINRIKYDLELTDTEQDANQFIVFASIET